MKAQGLRVHIAGSIALDTKPAIAAKVHEFIRELAKQLLSAGAGIVVSCGGEPICDCGHPATFDWTVLSEINSTSDSGENWPDGRRIRHCVVTSQRGLQKIPSSRNSLWARCQLRDDLELQTIQPNWGFGGAIRSKQMSAGDILIALGGGTGVEHLASIYRDYGKPVIPVAGRVRGSTDSAHGGADFLHRLALSQPSRFIAFREGTGSPATKLSALSLESTAKAHELAGGAISLIENLRPRRAFLVRLLDASHPNIGMVNRFFEKVVEPALIARDFLPHQVGRDQPDSAFMNVEIFRAIHRSSLVVVDLTGIRPNCMMELGYALGRNRPTAICAMQGTKLPFDQDKLPTYFWDRNLIEPAAIQDFGQHLEMAADLPPLVDSWVNQDFPAQ